MDLGLSFLVQLLDLMPVAVIIIIISNELA